MRSKKFMFVWDKTNIGENYPEKTLPLTYSFVRDAYASVYPHFLRFLGIRSGVINQNRFIFENMLGYIEGEIFYNINNWYEFLKLLPGYSVNKKFFEYMLQPVKNKKDTNAKVGPSVLWSNKSVVLKFLYLLLFFKRSEDEFDRKFDFLYKDFTKLKLSELSQFQLISQFKATQEKFFSLWAITIVNDFRTMIYFGLLNECAKKMLNNPDKYISSVVSIKNQPRSILPLHELKELKDFIKNDKKNNTLFQKNAGDILDKLKENEYKQLRNKLNIFLEKYGERSFNELKLEQPKLKDDPEIFMYILKLYVNSVDSPNETKRISYKSEENLPVWNKLFLNFLREQCASAIYLREHFRLKRAKVFGLARATFLELGMRLKNMGDLEDEKDAFYLYKDELFDYMQYHRLRTNFKKIINERKEKFKRVKKKDLGKRILTKNFPNQNELIPNKTRPKRNASLKGVVTSRGFVDKGEALVLNEIDYTRDFAGKILVTKATDPGWTIIFPLLTGVITETGGVLSHASIISRELGVPCIVKVPDATKIIRTGDLIKMDAYSGRIDLIK